MRVRNNLKKNIGVIAKSTGVGLPPRILIPAGSTLELDDEFWTANFAEPAQSSIDSKALTIVKAVVLSKDEEAAIKSAKLEEARALIAAAEADEDSEFDFEEAEVVEAVVIEPADVDGVDAVIVVADEDATDIVLANEVDSSEAE